MCTAVEEYCVEREKRGISQTKNEIAKNLLKDGMPVEKIAKITELSLEEVKALVKEQQEVLLNKSEISVVRYSGDFVLCVKNNNKLIKYTFKFCAICTAK